LLHQLKTVSCEFYFIYELMTDVVVYKIVSLRFVDGDNINKLGCFKTR